MYPNIIPKTTVSNTSNALYAFCYLKKKYDDVNSPTVS